MPDRKLKIYQKLVTQSRKIYSNQDGGNKWNFVKNNREPDDATSQLVPCCCRFKIPRSEEQNVNIYIFKSLCRHQSFQQKSPEGYSCCAVSAPNIFTVHAAALRLVWKDLNSVLLTDRLILVEIDVVHRPEVTRQLVQDLPGAGFPDVDEAIGGSRWHHFAVRRPAAVKQVLKYYKILISSPITLMFFWIKNFLEL